MWIDLRSLWEAPQPPFSVRLAQYKQLVLFDEGQDEAVRVNHAQRMFFGAATVATVAALWWLWPTTKSQAEPEEEIRRSDHSLLHRYRTGYQTVGQPTSLLYRKSIQPGEDAEPYEVKSARPDLHLYRTGYQTVGQSYRQWPRAGYRIEDEDYQPAKPVDLSAFRNSQPVVATAGQPWFIWPRPAQAIEPEDYKSPPPSLFALTRVTQQTAIAGQPWYLWPSAEADQTIEDDARRSDHTLLHRYRVGYQTVGQPWAYRIKPQARLDEETYTVPGPASLYPYRQVTVTVSAGQPWWLWPAVKGDQTVEPPPVVTDHAAALYPFRPHPAIAVVATPPDVTGGWPIYYGHRIRKTREVSADVPHETLEQTHARIIAVQQKLADRKELRKQERRSQRVTEEIRLILDQQDALKLSIAALELQLQQAGLDDDDIALILALAG